MASALHITGQGAISSGSGSTSQADDITNHGVQRSDIATSASTQHVAVERSLRDAASAMCKMAAKYDQVLREVDWTGKLVMGSPVRTQRWACHAAVALQIQRK